MSRDGFEPSARRSPDHPQARECGEFGEMFADNPELAPISMILTNLAGHAYNGEADVNLAARGILSRMLDFVHAERPRVPNPTHPAEDYADKWSKDARFELNFRGGVVLARCSVADATSRPFTDCAVLRRCTRSRRGRNAGRNNRQPARARFPHPASSDGATRTRDSRPTESTSAFG